MNEGSRPQFLLAALPIPLPVRMGTVVLVGAGFPIAIPPRIVAELRSVPKLFLIDVGAEAAELGVIREGIPRNGVVAMPEAQESTEADHGVRDAAVHLVDHEVVNLADVFAVRIVHLGSFDIFAGDQRLPSFPLVNLRYPSNATRLQLFRQRERRGNSKRLIKNVCCAVILSLSSLGG